MADLPKNRHLIPATFLQVQTQFFAISTFCYPRHKYPTGKVYNNYVSWYVDRDICIDYLGSKFGPTFLKWI